MRSIRRLILINTRHIISADAAQTASHLHPLTLYATTAMAAAPNPEQLCSTTGCSNSAALQCPTCLKLGIQGSYFCSQVRYGIIHVNQMLCACM